MYIFDASGNVGKLLSRTFVRSLKQIVPVSFPVSSVNFTLEVAMNHA